MSPTVFREGPFRAHFFSLEETRMHIHVQSPDGEVKIWLEPEIEIARTYGLKEQDLNRILKIVAGPSAGDSRCLERVLLELK